MASLLAWSSLCPRRDVPLDLLNFGDRTFSWFPFLKTIKIENQIQNIRHILEFKILKKGNLLSVEFLDPLRTRTSQEVQIE